MDTQIMEWDLDEGFIDAAGNLYLEIKVKLKIKSEMLAKPALKDFLDDQFELV